MGELTVYIETYGCSNNLAESQIMAGLLTRSGFEIVKSIELADIIILNTCSVKATTVNKIIFRIEQIKRNYANKKLTFSKSISLCGKEKHYNFPHNKKLIIAGCMPETEYELIKNKFPGISLISTNHITKIVRAVSGTLEGEIIEFVGKNKELKLCLPKIRSGVTDIIPICSGCNSLCYFCNTRIAKGDIFSYPEDKIIKEVSDAKKSGTKEFWLTGQDVSAYGIDTEGKPVLYKLLNAITENVAGKYFLRIGMLNPKNVLRMSNELLKAYRPENIFKFLHLPVQSGSDRILKKMNRNYKTDDFIDIVKKFRRFIPKITVWTDIIVGFSDETENDFEKSVELVKSIKPDYVNISHFSSHHSTPASGMKQIKTQVKKERSIKLTKIVDEICLEKNREWVGWTGEILINKFNKEKMNFIGRNSAYKPVAVLTREKLRLGQFVNVKIVDAKPSCLIGELNI